MRLLDVIGSLRHDVKINIFVNWAALEAAGIEQDERITLELREVPAHQVLRVLMRYVVSRSLEPADFGVYEGIVMISTRRDLQKTTETHVRDARLRCAGPHRKWAGAHGAAGVRPQRRAKLHVQRRLERAEAAGRHSV